VDDIRLSGPEVVLRRPDRPQEVGYDQARHAEDCKELVAPGIHTSRTSALAAFAHVMLATRIMLATSLQRFSPISHGLCGGVYDDVCSSWSKVCHV